MLAHTRPGVSLPRAPPSARLCRSCGTRASNLFSFSSPRAAPAASVRRSRQCLCSIFFFFSASPRLCAPLLCRVRPQAASVCCSGSTSAIYSSFFFAVCDRKVARVPRSGQRQKFFRRGEPSAPRPSEMGRNFTGQAGSREHAARSFCLWSRRNRLENKMPCFQGILSACAARRPRVAVGHQRLKIFSFLSRVQRKLPACCAAAASANNSSSCLLLFAARAVRHQCAAQQQRQIFFLWRGEPPGSTPQ